MTMWISMVRGCGSPEGNERHPPWMSSSLGVRVNPLMGFASLIPVPTTASGQVREVVMLVGIVVAAVLLCACTVVVLRRRSRSRG